MRSTAVTPTVIHLHRGRIGLLLAGVAAGAVGLAAVTYSPPWAAEGDRPTTPPAAAERIADAGAAARPTFALTTDELAVGYAGQVAAEGTGPLAPAPQPAYALSAEELAVGHAGQAAAAERATAGTATDLP
jgi:hypothetical protein